MYLSLLHVNADNRPARQWLGNLYRVHQRLWMAFPENGRREQDPFFLGQWSGSPHADPKPKRSQTGFLFRLERDGPPRILVQSADPPDWNYAFQNAPYLLHCNRMAETVEFDPRPVDQQVYRFRLLANVVDRRSLPDPKQRKRRTRSELVRKRRTEVLVHPHELPHELPTDPDERNRILSARWDPWRDWISKVGTKGGFQVLNETSTPLSLERVSAHVRNARAKAKVPTHQSPIDWRFNGGLFEGALMCTDSVRLRETIISGIGPAKAFGFGLLSVAPVR